MYNVFINFANKEDIYIMEKALKDVKYDSTQIKAIVAETILGRSEIPQSSGLVFAAYDMKEYDLARRFLQFVYELLTPELSDSDILPRIKRDIDKCNQINKILKLGVSDKI